MEKLKPWITKEAKAKLNAELLQMMQDIIFGTEPLACILEKYSDRVFFISSASVTSEVLS
ncbi:hypothetical protein ND814_15125 [Leptospira bandrabouensis]|uniref:hypothetical protein n=1 Tax=Leptospira bandrabouensis TaxID=2484903 RepID=UPI00223CE7A2|nr:hypothetical protein [Leptospira bandrabouensis]MCW7486305.1 hypothetical protein [Leptospira bandrabouensis]